MTPEERERLIEARLQAYRSPNDNPDDPDIYGDQYEAWVQQTEALDLSHMEVYEIEQEARRRFEEGRP